MPIINPTPVSTSVFNKLWINVLQIVFPVDKPKGFLNASFIPWDGKNLLAVNGPRLHINDLDDAASKNAELQTVLNDIKATAASLSKNNSDLRNVLISAPNSDGPIICILNFKTGDPYRIFDCDKLAKTDANFASVFQNTLVAVSKLANFTVA